MRSSSAPQASWSGRADSGGGASDAERMRPRARHRGGVPAARLRSLRAAGQLDDPVLWRPGVGARHRAPHRGAARRHRPRRESGLGPRRHVLSVAAAAGDRTRLGLVQRCGHADASGRDSLGRPANHAGGLARTRRRRRHHDSRAGGGDPGRVGARVHSATSAIEGLRAIEQSTFDVILCDIAMPGEDGYGFMQRLRQLDAARGGTTPAIALRRWRETKIACGRLRQPSSSTCRSRSTSNDSPPP
jgi:hypothetical protein